MIVEVKMWSAICDDCGATFEIDDSYTAMSEKDAVEENIIESGEWVLLEDDRCFCSDCHVTAWDEDNDCQMALTKDTLNSGSTVLGKVK